MAIYIFVYLCWNNFSNYDEMIFTKCICWRITMYLFISIIIDFSLKKPALLRRFCTDFMSFLNSYCMDLKSLNRVTSSWMNRYRPSIVSSTMWMAETQNLPSEKSTLLGKIKIKNNNTYIYIIYFLDTWLFWKKWGSELTFRHTDHVRQDSFQVKSENHEICR